MQSDDGTLEDGTRPEERFGALEDGFVALSADSDVLASERAERLAAFEQELLAFSTEQAKHDPAFGGDKGHPALSLGSTWRDLMEDQGLDEEANAAEAFVDDLIQDEAVDWFETTDAAAAKGDAAECFEKLTEATMLGREALARQRYPSLPVGVGPQQAKLRQAFLDAIQRDEPDAWTRHKWGVHLVDTAEVVMTAIDELEPARAVMHLDMTIDDLRWYLHNAATLPATRRRLKRKLRILKRERQERDLQGKLYARFGKQRVRQFDKLIVWLIFFVIGALFYEVFFAPSLRTRLFLLVGDTFACLLFLLDFFVRLYHVRGKSTWFVRHFLIDFLPSIPFTLIGIRMGMIAPTDLVGIAKGQSVRVVRIARLLRLFRLTRFARALGFLARGFDRIARRYGHLLNHNIVLYPNRQERKVAERERQSLATRAWRLRSRLSDEWRRLLQDAPSSARAAVALTRVEGLEAARDAGHTERPARAAGLAVSSVRDIPAEELLRKMQALTAGEIEADVGPDFVARCARATRVFHRIPLRWLPIIRKAVPRLTPAMSDAQVTAAASHRISGELQRHLDRRFWVADLHGTVTPSEFVDRVGSAMVRSSSRPAYRLLLFGFIYLTVRLASNLAGFGLPQFIESLVNNTLLVLGSICFVILGFGWWMKRLAGQATTFYEDTAHAQFLSLTEGIKGRYLERDATILDRRVFGPEEVVQDEPFAGGAPARQEAFVSAVRSWLIRARAATEMKEVPVEMQRAVLLYRDGLDGALLCDSDIRTTSQLLGNPALRELRGLSGRVDKREQKALRALDLSRARTALRGPYLWFSFITKAIAQTTARLIVEYNRNAIPLSELPFVAMPERRRYEAWVKSGEPEVKPDERGEVDAVRGGYVTTAFTALHFLDDDPARDHEVAERFGPAVLENLVRDRKALFREIFGTYPLHTRSKESRVLNLYRVYQSWLGGGRAFLIPLRVLWRWIYQAGRFLRWLVRSIGEIRTPRRYGYQGGKPSADFATALRKVGRMRGPIVGATLWLRARFDAEYLGVHLPGTDASGLEDADWARDLEFLGAPPKHVRRFEEEQSRAEADARRLARLVESGLFREVAEAITVPEAELGREHMRAALCAYRADFHGIRTLLSCQAILEETTARALDTPPQPRPLWPRPALKRAFKRWWKKYGSDEKEARRSVWRAVAFNRGGAGDALRAWAKHGVEGAQREGVALLADFLRHPGRISEQLVTLRTVQTLALIDMLNYREHVYRLGAYEELGDDAGDALRLLDEEAPPGEAVAPAG